MNIGIIGGGVVGDATAYSFREFHCVIVYDILSERSTRTIPYRTPKEILARVLAADIVFICLPTPQKTNSLECDTSILDDFLASISKEGSFKDVNFVLKSTVPVGYTRHAREVFGLPNLVHSPEFLTARTAREDACNPTRLIIGNSVTGYEKPYGSPLLWSAGNRAAELLNILYHQRWPNVPIFLLSSDESEAVKLFQNAFSAVKIAFFNEIRAFADDLDLEWDRVMTALLAGGWISPMHTQVPGPDGKFGFGGTCLPKDLANLVYLLGDWAVVTKAALIRNLEDRQR